MTSFLSNLLMSVLFDPVIYRYIFGFLVYVCIRGKLSSKRGQKTIPNVCANGFFLMIFTVLVVIA